MSCTSLAGFFSISIETEMAEEGLRLLQEQIAGLRNDLIRRQEEALTQARRVRKERPHIFRRPGNESQYAFAEKMLEHIDSAIQFLDQEGRTEDLRRELEEVRTMLAERQRMIKLADRSELGWAVVAEYEADELANNSEDERKIARAEREAEKKVVKRRRLLPGGGSLSRSQGLKASTTASVMPRPVGPCFGCGEMGHLRRYCPKIAGPEASGGGSE